MSDFDPHQPPPPAPTVPQPYGPEQPSNGIAVAALVLGIISIPAVCLTPYISLPCAILAIVFGALGRSAARRGAQKGSMATAGLICGLIPIALFVIAIVGCLTCLGVSGVSFNEFVQQMEQIAQEAQRVAESMPASAPATP